MKIVKAVVLAGMGADKIFLTTDLPNSFAAYQESLTLSFEATSGTGIEYVKKHFKIVPETIYRTRNTPKYSNK